MMAAYTSQLHRIEAGSIHLDKECESFYRQAALMTFVRKWDDSRHKSDAGTAALEAWLVHFRGLLLAFRSNRPGSGPDDILFRDYLDDADWQVHGSKLVPSDEDEGRIDDVGRFLAHISYARDKDVEKSNWKQADYFRVDDRLRLWHELLTPTRKGWFRRLAIVLEEISTPARKGRAEL